MTRSTWPANMYTGKSHYILPPLSRIDVFIGLSEPAARLYACRTSKTAPIELTPYVCNYDTSYYMSWVLGWMKRSLTFFQVPTLYTVPIGTWKKVLQTALFRTYWLSSLSSVPTCLVVRLLTAEFPGFFGIPWVFQNFIRRSKFPNKWPPWNVFFLIIW